MTDEAAMRRALELARRGEGAVEPNPMVGCVLIARDNVVGEGWHERFGGPHAEVNALRAAGEAARGATAVVTLEPCCHTGKTPPCARALVTAGVARVVVGAIDPFPKVDGGGVAALRAEGIACEVGVLREEAEALIAPFRKRVETGRPWVIAKWAMTLDGRIATRTGDSQWITGERARARGHVVRGRVDAVIVGAGTLVADDPLLTARPPGPRTPMRVVIAGDRPLPAERRLWASLDEGPVLVATGTGYPTTDAERLRGQGVEVIAADPPALLDELGRREMTNALVDGGGKLLGRLFDLDLVDEVHASLGAMVLGGADAPGPVAGEGVAKIGEAVSLVDARWEAIDGDLRVVARVRR
ncbi:MAG: bifunctional diaminohydroxyphosphoribosylaminopyrimidine deaminase/5-amino-6-(5-phosphoribosylamino)uracil reductase RibD [Planctomycetota bacterium]